MLPIRFNMSSGMVNVVYMSISFFLLFTADVTILNMEKTIISSIHDDYNDFEVDGYDLLSLLYIFFGVSLWLGPSAVSLIGLRTSLTIASFIYTIYIASFATETAWAIYAATAVGGIGAGLLWTAEGKYLVLNSTPDVVSRNIGIFWTFFCSSSFFGNLFTYYKLLGKKYIDKETREWIIYSLTGVAAIATVTFALLRPVANKGESQSQVDKHAEGSSALKEFKKTWNVFKTKEMLLLCVPFAYTGLQQAFNGGIYSPSIGFTLQFGNSAKQLVPLSGIFVGVGQILGGFWQIIQGQRLSKLKWGRRIVIGCGVLAQLISFVLIFINIPSSAVFGNTNDKAFIDSNVYIALLSSLLLGIGDGCLNTQNFSIIALIFPNESAQSCALYKFTKAIFVAVGYSMSSFLNLHFQLGVLTLLSICGLIAYTIADVSAVKIMKNTQKTTSSNEANIKNEAHTNT